MKIMINTQYMENYGTAEAPYWKFKGGSDYIIEVEGFRFDNDMAGKKARMIVDELAPKIEYSGDYSQEYILDWSFVEDDYLTDFEKSQLEYDGEITFPAKRVTYEEFMTEEAA